MSIVKKVYNEYVIIKRDEAEKETASGLILADSAVEAPSTGVVFATFSEDEVAIGEKVLYQRGAGIPIEIDGVGYLVLRKVEIICAL